MSADDTTCKGENDMSVELSTPKNFVDLADPKNFQDTVPHEEFERLRNEDPVHWTPTQFGTATGGFWSLTRYADVEAATRDTQTFTSSLGVQYPANYDEPPLMVDNLSYNDPPRHGELRAHVGNAFAARVVARFEGWITERVNIILDGLEGRGECDLVPLVAVELPAQVICSVMGVPEDKRRQVVTWIEQFFARLGSDGGQEVARAATEAILNFAVELRDASEDLLADDTMLGELARVERDGMKITDSEFMQTFMTLLVAGFETTHTTIAQSLRLLLEDPDIAAQARIAHENNQIRELGEEFLRYISPALHMARHATRDVELHGQTIRKGDMVLLWYASANRDSEIFENPHHFDAFRKPNRHQAFGAIGGPHYCIGASLARLEVQILLREMFSRNMKITLNGTPKRGVSVFINQLVSLPVVCE
jgi:cholest-4-en-3-one 26-monooxygenase